MRRREVCFLAPVLLSSSVVWACSVQSGGKDRWVVVKSEIEENTLIAQFERKSQRGKVN